MKLDVNFKKWKDWAIGSKLAVAIGVMSIPVFIYGFELYVEEQKLVDHAVQEDLGFLYLEPLHALIVEVSRHRDLNALHLSRTGDFIDRLNAQTAQVNRAFEAMAVAEEEYGDLFDRDHIFDTILAEWETLRDHELDISEEVSLREHDLMLDQLFEHNNVVASESGLNQDPDAENYFLIDLSVHKLPILFDKIARLRQLATEALGRGALTVEEKIELAGDEYVVIELFEESKADFEFAVKDDATSRARLTPAFNSFEQRLQILLDDIETIEHEALEGREFGISADEMFNDATGAVDAGVAFLRAVEPVLLERLEIRLEESRAREITYLGSGLIGLFFAGLVSLIIIRGVARDNQKLNDSIIELLRAAGRLAQNDLTTRVPVAENITGAVSDALNLLADSTANVLGEVVDISGQVAKRANVVQNQAQEVMVVAKNEQEIVETASNQLTVAAAAMVQIAKLSEQCSQAGTTAIGSTQKAVGTVGSTIAGINIIRDTIRETEKRIKRLGERSQEISGVVTLINNIAERTHILALNASMHAASAGEAGRGFAVVANEVQRLAENAREATADISGLVSNIQVETSDTVVAMNNAISEVVKGTNLAEQAGAEMNETSKATGDLVELVKQIAESSVKQAEMSETLRENTTEIQTSTQETYQKLEEQMRNTRALVSFSNGLVKAVSVFTLPEELVRKASSTLVEPDDFDDAEFEEGLAANA